MLEPRYVLKLSCANRPGLVAAVAGRLFAAGCNILESSQFDDLATERFFMRMEINSVGETRQLDSLRRDLEPVAGEYGMEWTLHDQARRPRVLLMVSRFDHCLADLLYRWRIGELVMDIAGIVSNHPAELYAHLHLDGIPFHHLPVTKENKPEQEARLLRIIEEADAELVVLARYMQVLSDAAVAALAGRCINIHHSFLPGFKGAKPYHQAHARGVKLIGATAHYVTAELDEGPIIEQDVERVSHYDSPDALVRKGRDIERRVLARAVAFHLQGRVLLNGATTVVFRD